MKNLEQMECKALTNLECQQIDGGSDKPRTNFWNDFAYVSGQVIRGFVIFGSEGGSNTGIPVR